MKKQIIMTIASWLTLGVFMGTTRPGALPVALLILPFVLLFMAIVSSWGLIALCWNRYLMHNDRPRKLHRFNIVLSASVVALVVLQSLRQLTPRDLLTVAAIIVIGYLYTARNHKGLDGR